MPPDRETSPRELGLSLEVEANCLRGRVTDETGAVREFSGWLGLLSALDRALLEPRSQDSP